MAVAPGGIVQERKSLVSRQPVLKYRTDQTQSNRKYTQIKPRVYFRG